MMLALFICQKIFLLEANIMENVSARKVRKTNISLHIKNIFDEEELDINSTVKEFLMVQ